MEAAHQPYKRKPRHGKDDVIDKVKSNNRGKRSPQQRDIDDLFVSDLYTKGYTFREIAIRLNANLEKREMPYRITFQQVYNDIKRILIQWKRDRFETIDQWMQLELRKLDKMEAELWDAWERSKEGKRKTKINGGSILNGNVSGGTLDNRQMETSNGDARYFDLLLDVMEKRSKLLGLDKPTKIEFTKPLEIEENQKIDWGEVPDDLLYQFADKLQNAISKNINPVAAPETK